jgi:Type I restriction enzyme R protein N terminus (HSDR_N)
MITNARNVTLGNLRQAFGIKLNSDDRFFGEWLDTAVSLTQSEQQGLDRLSHNFTYLSQEEPPLEEVVKLVVISPLLDLAGFYQAPFLIKTEVSTSLEVTDDLDNPTIQGKIDILIVQDHLWIIVIESKPARLDVTVGIPQALTYMLNAKHQQICYGMVTNGREVLFLRLNRSQDLPQYSRSPTYRLLENYQERHQVLQGLKQIGAELTKT